MTSDAVDIEVKNFIQQKRQLSLFKSRSMTMTSERNFSMWEEECMPDEFVFVDKEGEERIKRGGNIEGIREIECMNNEEIKGMLQLFLNIQEEL